MTPEKKYSEKVYKMVDKVVDAVVVLVILFAARDNMPLVVVCSALLVLYRLTDIRYEIRQLRKE